MAKLTLKKGLTDVTVYLFVQDSSKTTGEGLTGLAYNTANLVASYVRPLGSRTAITLATLAEVTSAHTDGGFKEIDATNMPGVYRLDLPDAVCATGVPSVVVMLKGASNMTPVLLEIQLTDFDLNSTSNTVGTVTNLTNLPSIPNNWLTAAGIAADAVTEIQSGLATTQHVQEMEDKIDIIDGVVDAVKAKTDQLAFTVANQVDANVLTGGGATAEDVRIEMDLNSTKLADILADTGTDGVVLKAAGLSADAVVEIQSGLATTQHVQEMEDKIDIIDGVVDAVKAKIDLITTGTTLTLATAVSGSTITAHRGDTLSAALENIGALTNNSKLWFTVKRDYDDADTAAVIQIEKTGGLLYLNGAVGTAGNGSLTINDEATGDVTIVLNASETAKLSPGNYQYDIQILRSAGTPVSTLTYGEFVVPADVTRATS